MNEDFERENERIKEDENGGFKSFSHSDFGNTGFGKLGFGEEKEDFKSFESTEKKENGKEKFGSFRTEDEKFDFSEKEENEKGKAWYENTGDSWYRSNRASDEFLKDQKSEHRVHAMLEEHAKHSHAYTEKEREKNVSEFDGAFEKQEKSYRDGKIYLPKEEIVFDSDSIKNPREYIARNFEHNASLERLKGKPSPVFIFFAVCFAVLALSQKFSSFYVWIFIMIAAVFFFLGKAKKPSFLKKPEEFFLIKPYAIEKKEKGSGGVYELFLYYKANGKERTAMTVATYNEEEIEILTQDFLEGELIVACRIADGQNEPDIAVVCSPDF